MSESRFDVVSHKGTQHLSSYIDDKEPKYIAFRSGLHDMQYLYKKISESSQNAADAINNCGFGSLFTIDLPNGDQKLVQALFERWWRSTNSFHFPRFEMTLTPLDFTFLTGIPVGIGRTPVFKVNHDPNDIPIFQAKYPNLFVDFVDKFNPSRSNGFPTSILKKFIDKHNDAQIMEHWEEVTRCFLLWVIGHIFFPNSASVVKWGWLYVVDDLNATNQYDWGGAILARIYMSLGECSSGEQKNFNGFWHVIEYWFYTYFNTCTPQLKSEIVDVFPRMCLYNKTNRKKKQKDMGKHSVLETRHQIEIMGVGGIIWNPWARSFHINNEHVVRSSKISLCRYILFEPEVNVGIMYLGERSLRQLLDHFYIPCRPPSENILHFIPESEYLEKLRTPQKAIDFAAHVDWKQYKAFWGIVSIGKLMEEGAKRQKNRNFIGTHDPNAQVCEPPPIGKHVHQYSSQSQAGSSATPFMDWKMDICDSSGVNVTVPVTSRSPPTVIEPDQYTPVEYARFLGDRIDYAEMLRRMSFELSQMHVQENRELHEQIRCLSSRNNELEEQLSYAGPSNATQPFRPQTFYGGYSFPQHMQDSGACDFSTYPGYAPNYEAQSGFVRYSSERDNDQISVNIEDTLEPNNGSDQEIVRETQYDSNSATQP